ncbi:MAG: hypothetical protein JO032_02285 [Alphaproteobacteria bacterium]|nr:hypothetical protein [Alphaproteobacteria bacterium]
MRVFVVLWLIPLAGCVGSDRQEGFTAIGPNAFQYSARTSTVMTENDDGEAEDIRHAWLVDALKAHAMCPSGYVMDTRRFVPGPPTEAGPQFSNGGDILYAGRCIVPSAQPVPVAPPPVPPPPRG